LRNREAARPATPLKYHSRRNAAIEARYLPRMLFLFARHLLLAAAEYTQTPAGQTLADRIVGGGGADQREASTRAPGRRPEGLAAVAG